MDKNVNQLKLVLVKFIPTNLNINFFLLMRECNQCCVIAKFNVIRFFQDMKSAKNARIFFKILF